MPMWQIVDSIESLSITLATKCTCDDDMEGETQAIKQRFSSLQIMLREGSLFDLLLEMRKRVSTNPVHKVAGLAYFVRSDGAW